MFSIYKEPVIRELKPRVNPNNVSLFIKREDLIHPVISGNKWRKLKYNLQAARESGYQTLLTFGGAYSNHIHATAGAAHDHGFKSIGIIRGEEHLPLNPTLKEASAMGMRLYYMDRITYRNKHTKEVIDDLHELFGDFYLIPEGGTNELAIKGAAEIVSGLENDFDCLITACGTAGTVTGIIAGMKGMGKVIGISVLKGDFHQQDIHQWLEKLNLQGFKNWEVKTIYHFGGYARYNLELIRFINEFRNDYKIPLDPIYTGKMMFAVFDMIAKGQFEPGTRVLTIHTGGLQGIKGFNKRFNNLISV